MSLNWPVHLRRQIKKPAAGANTPPSFGRTLPFPQKPETVARSAQRKNKYCSEELEKVFLGFMFASKCCYQLDRSGVFAAQNHMYVQELVGSLGGNTQSCKVALKKCVKDKEKNSSY